MGLLVYHVAKAGSPEAQHICQAPQTGPWQRARLATSVADLVKTVEDTGANFSITNLGILSHGDANGAFVIGKDTVNPDSLGGYRAQLGKLERYLAPDADVLVLGCVSGGGKAGSDLLKALSRILPGRRVIGFNVVNVVRPNFKRKEGGKPCYDPDVWATLAGDSLTLDLFKKKVGGARIEEAYVNRADASAPQAKIAKDGQIVKWAKKWPKFEEDEIDADEKDELKRKPKELKPKRKFGNGG